MNLVPNLPLMDARTSTLDGPRPRYDALIAAEALSPDPAQAAAVDRLQSLHDALASNPGAEREESRGFLSRLFGSAPDPTPAADAPRGLYIWGDVGRGKSMLMDLFFETAPVEKKRRVHFHAFMLEVHRSIHAWRQATKAENRRADDPIPPLAERIASQTMLLCFDEFHVTDIADAMILARLFTALLNNGLVMVATSNWPPHDLYMHGLQREQFTPFIDLVVERLDVVELEAAKDYRLARLIGTKVYHTPLGPAASAALSKTFADLTDEADADGGKLEVGGRALPTVRQAKGVGWFDYATLCREPRGTADFIAVCEAFHTVIVDGVPRLPSDRHDETKRFMTLVDTLYEYRVNLVMAADAPPYDLYRGKVLAFEFKRTSSRLNEMQSADYIAETRRTDAAAT